MNPLNTFTWLALDPALVEFGWALFCDDQGVHSCQLYKAGVWRTEKAPELKRMQGKSQKPGVVKDTAARVHYLGEQLAGLVQAEHPVAIFVESLAMPFGRTGMLTVSTLGRIRGVIEGIALTLGVPVFEFNSQTVKHALTGRRDAEKEQVATRVLQLYPSLRLFLPGGRIAENITDAAAIGHLGEQHEVIELHRHRRAVHDLAGEISALEPSQFDYAAPEAT